MEDRSIKAEELFKEGYNCAQAVAIAYADEMGVSKEQAARIASPFGGGMGRMREVCGAVSGMLLVQGGKEGYSDPKAKEEKQAVYGKAREMAEKFRDENGSIVCRELLGLDKKEEDSEPQERTEGYYQKRPCSELVRIAAGIVAESLE